MWKKGNNFCYSQMWLVYLRYMLCKLDVYYFASVQLVFRFNGVFPKWIQKFGEFSKFRESDKPLKHELGLI